MKRENLAIYAGYVPRNEEATQTDALVKMARWQKITAVTVVVSAIAQLVAILATR